jgi:hypothetical protein
MSASIKQIQEVINRTREARERVLQHRSTDAIIGALAQTAKNWLEPSSPWRLRAIEAAPQPTGFSEAMVREAIDLTFGVLTYEAFGEVLDRELGNRRVLDEFCLHASGIFSICCGLLLKSANIVKASVRDPVFPALFVESLREVDAELADCVGVLDWGREELALTQTALAEANAVIAYGDDHTISALRQIAPPEAVFLGYGHKISFAIVAKEAMTAENLPALAEAAAFDASVYDQQGCLSPHVFYVEERGQLGPRKFAAALAEAMAAYQGRIARGPLTVEEAAELTRIRTGYEFRAESDRRVAVWSGVSPNDWVVVYEDDPSFIPSCLNRVVFVKPTDGFKRVLDAIQRFAPNISTVGVSPLNERSMAFAADLSKMGVHRICPIGQMQRPPLSWHHDGLPNLADLVRWTDAG